MKKSLSLITIVAISVLGMVVNSETVSAANSKYNDNYGVQLSSEGNSKLIYDKMVQEYVYQDGDAGNEDGKYTGLAQNVNFITKQMVVDISDYTYSMSLVGKTNLQIESERNIWIQSVVNEIMSEATAAFDAFVKDYPEVYWLYSMEASISYEIAIRGTDMNISVGQAYLVPKEYYTNMVADINKFNEAVIVAKKFIETTYGLNKKSSTRDVSKAIHDYIATRVDYNYEAAANNVSGSYAYAYTAMPVFMDNVACQDTVCEGYAKSFSILCTQFGVDNAIISGYAYNDGKAVGHMWNSVMLEDDKWYAVDVTWDDQESKIYYNYFLAGQNSKGFQYTYGTDHMAQKVFSSYEYSKEFVMPDIAENGYLEEGTFVTMQTATNVGSTVTQNKQTVTDDTMTQKVNNKVAVEKNKSKEKKNKESSKDNTEEKSKKKTTKQKATKVGIVSIKNATFSKIKTQRLKKGKSCKPVVKITYDGKKLKKNQDYTVTYKNNKKKGTGKVIVKGKGEFKGQKVIKFKIK